LGAGMLSSEQVSQHLDTNVSLVGKDAPAYKLAAAGSMGESTHRYCIAISYAHAAGGIAGVVGNPGEIIMVRMQGDFAKPPEKRLNYKNCFDGLFRVRCSTSYQVVQFLISIIHSHPVQKDGPRRRRI
jgi:hypothetical protein